MDQVVITASSATSLSTSSQSDSSYHFSNTIHPSLRSSYLDSEKLWLPNHHMNFPLSPDAANSAASAIPSQIPPSALIQTTLFYPLQNISLSPSMMVQRPPTTVSSVSNCTSKTLSGSGRSSASLNADIVPPSTWVSSFTCLVLRSILFIDLFITMLSSNFFLCPSHLYFQICSSCLWVCS